MITGRSPGATPLLNLLFCLRHLAFQSSCSSTVQREILLLSLTPAPFGSPGPHPRPSARGPWPGGLLPPEPTLEHRPPVPVECLDDEGLDVVVGGDGLLRARPARLVLPSGVVRLSVALGPWLGDERWWEPPGRRAARLQVVAEGGSAHVLLRREGRWWLEATYD
jgi:hypothetical protein